MTYIFRIFLPALLLILASCRKNEFTLVFQLDPEINANYTVTYYSNSKTGGLTVQAVASVQGGRAELKGATIEPTLIYITEKYHETPLVIYAKSGQKFKLTGDNRTPMTWKVSGSKINEDISDWRQEFADTISRKKPEEINAAIESFVRQHPSNPASTLILLTYYDRTINEYQYASLMACLRGDARKEKWIASISRADQLESYIANPAKFESMIVRSAFNGADTLTLNKQGPTFLIFWQNGMTGRKDMVDSLKLLIKEFPDSTLRTIADISTDTDSTAWRGPLKRDSLSTLTRGWIPAGMADPDVMKLKITSIPYYIVFDTIGNQSYRGNDLSAALKEFRKLHPHKDK